MIGAKFRQMRFALRAGSATLGYPFAPHPAEPGARGRVTVDTGKCVGCAGCADVCPARLIMVTDVSRELRIMRRHLDRCILCGRCESACPYDAVHLVPEYETATTDRTDLMIEQRLFMGVCDRCGRCYTPKHPLDRLMATGWRYDEPELIEAAGGAPAPADREK